MSPVVSSYDSRNIVYCRLPPNAERIAEPEQEEREVREEREEEKAMKYE